MIGPNHLLFFLPSSSPLFPSSLQSEEQFWQVLSHPSCRVVVRYVAARIGPGFSEGTQEAETSPSTLPHPANFQPESSVLGVDVVSVPTPLACNCRGYIQQLPWPATAAAAAVAPAKSGKRTSSTQSLATGQPSWNRDLLRPVLYLVEKEGAGGPGFHPPIEPKWAKHVLRTETACFSAFGFISHSQRTATCRSVSVANGH